jgi:serine/threonine-protein kinase
MRDAKAAPEPNVEKRSKDPLLGVVLLDKYRILSVLASGGMGTVYRAEQMSLHREVAIKVTDKLDDASRKRFIREASILAKIQHPHILTVFDYGPLPNRRGGLFMAMELLQGQTLRDRFRAVGTLPAIELIGVVHQVARGLRAAHRQKLVHRDLKPSNLMLVDQDGGPPLVKILDFGLVKILDDEDVTEVTQAGTVVGSPQYVAPELLIGAEVDHRADIYALGIIMFQALAGRPPFDEPKVVHTLRAHVEKPVPTIASFNEDADVPPGLEALIRSCLAKSPGDRPADMDEVGRALHACEWELGVVPALPNTPRREGAGKPSAFPAPEPHGARPGRGRTVATLLATTLVASAVTWVAATRVHRSTTSPSTASALSLHVESRPPGATVRQGTRVLGMTPLQVPFDNEALREAPMTLSVELDGHVRVEVVQGPSNESVRIVAALSPSAAVSTGVISAGPP